MPALLAAVLAHVRRPDVCKASLSVLKKILADETAAGRVSGQGAYRIVLAVMQAHNCAAQVELVSQAHDGDIGRGVSRCGMGLCGLRVLAVG